MVRHVGALLVGEHGDGGVGLGGQDVYERVGVAVQRDGGAGLEELAVESGEDADVVVGACACERGGGVCCGRGMDTARDGDVS